MAAVSYQKLALTWRPQNSSDKPFILLLLLILVLFLGTGLFFSSIKVPEVAPRTKTELPERIARFILEKPKPVPKKTTPEKKPEIAEKPKTKAKPKPPPKPTVKRKKPEKPIELTKKQSVAREKAAQSGLIALSDELSDLIDTSSIDTMIGKPINKAGKHTQTASVNTSLLTADTMQESSDIKMGANLPSINSKTTLDTQQQAALARQLISARAEDNTKRSQDKSDHQPQAGNYRSEEEIAYVIDQNKSKLHAIYRSARRKNPGIKGMIVLEITILPSGKVEKIDIKSSELNNARLEARLIARITQFDFGARNVKKVTVTYPVEFLPS